MESPIRKKRRIFQKQAGEDRRQFRKKWSQYQPVRFDQESPKNQNMQRQMNMYRLACVNYGDDTDRYRQTVEKQSRRMKQFVEKIRISGSIQNLKRSLRTKTEPINQTQQMPRMPSLNSLLLNQNRQTFKSMIREVIQQIEEENQGSSRMEETCRSRSVSTSPPKKHKPVNYEELKSLNLLKDIKKQLGEMFNILHIN